MKQFFIFLLFVIQISNSSAQEIIKPSPIKWYTIEKAMELSAKEPRPIMLDVYTDWCSWCKFMMTTTFANKGIADYINNNFYAAKFNAETFDTVYFKGQKYFNRKIGSKPSHDLASILLDGKLSYPSLVFFDRDGNKTIIPGYKEAKDLEPILVYFAENVNKTAELNDFYINFMYSFPFAYQEDHSIFKIDNKLKPDTLGKITWVEPKNLLGLQRKKARPVILFFYTDWSIGSKVMERSTFRDREITSKTVDSYYMVKINAATTDTINFLGQKYEGTGINMPNKLAYTYLNNNFHMPAVVFLDDKNNVQGMINGYWAKSTFLPLIDFFLSGSNKKISFQEYLKTYKKT